MNLTPYQQEKFKHLDNMIINKWHKIDANRPDLKDFLECLNKYNEAWNLLKIEEGRFMKTYTERSIDWCKINNVEI